MRFLYSGHSINFEFDYDDAERKFIMVPNAAYNVFRSNSYVSNIENARQPLAPEIKPAQPQSSSTQLDVPPWRVS